MAVTRVVNKANRKYENVNLKIHVWKQTFLFITKKTSTGSKLPKQFLLLLVKIKGWYGVFRIEETKLVCAISGKLLWVEKRLCLHGGS